MPRQLDCFGRSSALTHRLGPLVAASRNAHQSKARVLKSPTSGEVEKCASARASPPPAALQRQRDCFGRSSALRQRPGTLVAAARIACQTKARVLKSATSKEVEKCASARARPPPAAVQQQRDCFSRSSALTHRPGPIVSAARIARHWSLPVSKQGPVPVRITVFRQTQFC